MVYTHRHTDRWEGFMEYAVEMGSGAMIYIPSFMKSDLGIQKLLGRITTRTTWRSYKPTFISSK
jgi:hypothetical protein